MLNATRLTRGIIRMTTALTIAGCTSTQQDAGNTDAFLRNAFDAYGVIDVVPAAAPRSGPVGQPLDAIGVGQRVATASSAPMS